MSKKWLTGGLTLALTMFGVPALAQESSDIAEPVVCQVQNTWTSQSTLNPGARDVIDRVKDRPTTTNENGETVELVDVAIDGWASATGIDAWSDAKGANFRIVFGTRIDIEQIDSVEVTFAGPDADLTPATASASSPAKGATPQELRGEVTDVVQPVIGENKISWDVTESGKLPAFHSAMANVSINTTAVESAEPIVAKMTVVTTENVPCDDVDGDGYTDIAEGSDAQCVIDWRLGSTTDRRLDDYSNNGYRYKVGHDDEGRATYGYGAIHHWMDPAATTLFHRIPLGTVDAIEAGTQVQLVNGSNWQITNVYELDQSTTPYFERFTGVAGFDSVVSGATYDATTGIVTLPAMPANSNIILMVEGASLDGSKLSLTEPYALDAFMTGQYTTEAYLARGCAGEQPAAETVVSDWEQTASVCLDPESGISEVTYKRSVTTTEYVFDTETRTWVLGEPVTTTETKTEQVEDSTCVAPTVEPNEPEATKPTAPELAKTGVVVPALAGLAAALMIAGAIMACRRDA